MAGSANKPKGQAGVTVITCTNRKRQFKSIFQNFDRQRHAPKELIIVVNHDRIPLQPYLDLANRCPNVRVYREPGRMPLGACLNRAVRMARYPYIAKFDDDDYYAPYYLTDILQAFKRTGADIVGKRTHYMYLKGSKSMILRFRGNENRYVSILPGATLVVKRRVFDRVRFTGRRTGEDDQFCRDSLRKGFKVYSAGKYNFVAIRRKNTASHTWTMSDKDLLAHHVKIPRVRDYKRFVHRRPGGTKP
ncbi:glycosyltransferase [Cohnella caldifontis]|uniref:glycosyltransferase n=1 Tax=Cohnella caldifontis TaxID=3027471 RepID=UPI0023EBD2DD|nr:glycosyltransferase [Cohnella sp. YIM B05605]